MSSLKLYAGFYKSSKLTRADGNEVDVMQLDLNLNVKKYAEATFYISIKDLFARDQSSFLELINEVVSRAIVASNSRMPADAQTSLKINLANEIVDNYSSLTTKEITNIINMGVRGLLATENNYVSIQNFVSWVQKYKTEKDSAMVHVINMVNSIHFDNNMEVDYTEQEKSINDILKLKDEKLKLLKIVRYTSVMPAILYSIFVSTKLLEDNEYLNFMEIAKNFIKVKNASNERNPLIHFVSSIDFLQNKDSLQEQKAKQFAIIKFLKSKKNVRLKIR